MRLDDAHSALCHLSFDVTHDLTSFCVETVDRSSRRFRELSKTSLGFSSAFDGDFQPYMDTRVSKDV